MLMDSSSVPSQGFWRISQGHFGRSERVGLWKLRNWGWKVKYRLGRWRTIEVTVTDAVENRRNCTNGEGVGDGQRGNKWEMSRGLVSCRRRQGEKWVAFSASGMLLILRDVLVEDDKRGVNEEREVWSVVLSRSLCAVRGRSPENVVDKGEGSYKEGLSISHWRNVGNREPLSVDEVRRREMVG